MDPDEMNEWIESQMDRFGAPGAWSVEGEEEETEESEGE